MLRVSSKSGRKADRRAWKRYRQSSVKRLSRRVKRLEKGMETKFFTQGPTAGGVNDIGDVVHLCNPSQGDSQVTRDGSRLVVKGISLTYHAYRNGADAIMRVMVINDKNNQISSVADLLDSADGTGFSPFGRKDWEKRFDIKTLYDRTFPIDNVANPHKVVKKYIKCNIPVQFSSSTTTITQNAIKLLIMSTNTSDATPTNQPQLLYTTRCFFIDP